MSFKKIIKSLGFKYPEKRGTTDIREKEFYEVYELCKSYSMTSIERMYSLYKSVDYILTNNIEGPFVECGVWRGGSVMLMAKMLKNRNSDRKVYLFDTFEGMSAPTENDKTWYGETATDMMKADRHNKEESVWCLATKEDVENNLKRTGYEEDNLIFIKGKVENTIPCDRLENKISLLRLDTDWYESTRHELNFLFPKLVRNGVLIIDDYGHWEGARKAVDEYFEEHKINMLLHRIDFTGRAGVKT